MAEPTARCQECGAPSVDGMVCWEVLGNILAWEWNDPALQSMHFLTVASYNLQHPAQFTDEAIAGLRAAVADYLDHGLSAQAIRKQVGRIYEGRKRVLKPNAERTPVLRPWSQTINAVYQNNQPTRAAERVREWATSIRQEFGA
ncbi:MAG: hypothetical protein H0X24_05270 [Ktedonobacterales bacterium]|nr:hypothetical protein [Ktedonobacterales bacterium]